MSTATDKDPHPGGAERFVGRTVVFDLKDRRAKGTVKAARYVGRTERGAIPDYEIEVQGQSGARVKVSLVETNAQFAE